MRSGLSAITNVGTDGVINEAFPEMLITLLDDEENVIQRFTTDNNDVTYDGFTFQEYVIQTTMNPDPEDGDFDTNLVMANTPEYSFIVQYLNTQDGIRGLTCQQQLIARGDPSTILWGTDLDILTSEITDTTIGLTLGFRRLANEKFMKLKFTPDKAPGIFS